MVWNRCDKRSEQLSTAGMLPLRARITEHSESIVLEISVARAVVRKECFPKEVGRNGVREYAEKAIRELAEGIASQLSPGEAGIGA